jgi:hypothetical protein
MWRRQLSTLPGSFSFHSGVSVVSAIALRFGVTETFPADES